MSKKQYKIQIVEDEKDVAEIIEKLIGSIGYEVVGISPSGKDAIYNAVEMHPDLVLMDIELSGETALT